MNRSINCYCIFLINSINLIGLFHKAIMESGSGLCDWALQSDPWDYAVQIGQRLRCPVAPRETLVDCLRVVPTLDLLRAQNNGKVSIENQFILNN